MRAAALALAGVLAFAGCGLKTSPVAPELVEPLPATDLQASPSSTGVRLTWRRPTHYTGGGTMRDIERFDVQRVEGDRTDWAVVGTLVMQDRYRLRQPRTIEWTDTSAAVGTTYQYRVVTVTRDGRASVPSKPASVLHRAVAPAPDAGHDPS
jgi:hypothetical protein